jgi:hypothetical protein
MQGGEDQVAGFGAGQRQADGFEVAHLADQDHVRVFAQAERSAFWKDSVCGPTSRWLIRHFFDWCTNSIGILDGEDVAIRIFIDMIDHRRQGGRLARAGRPGDQHDASRIIGDVLEDLRAVEFFERQHLRRNRPEYGPGAAILDEGVDPETRQIGNLEREIAFPRVLVLLALNVAHDVVHHGVHVLVLHRRQVDPPHVAVDPDDRWQARRQVEVGGLVLDTERK